MRFLRFLAAASAVRAASNTAQIRRELRAQRGAPVNITLHVSVPLDDDEDDDVENIHADEGWAFVPSPGKDPLLQVREEAQKRGIRYP